MNKPRLLAALFVLAVAGLAIWVASSGMRQGQGDGTKKDTPTSAYDYQATDVVITQMGTDGTLQYELSAKQISQEPNKGQIAAQDLVMHRDPPGSPPGGPNRWTLSAKHADLPEMNGSITLQGNVHAEGRPENSQATVVVAADELTYNLQTQEASSKKPVVVTRGNTTIDAQSLHLNIRTGDYNTGPLKVDSTDGTLAPK
ncbi:MAG: LPS export ABC transporter periplasmic protein LptC [Pseudomonadota bacterium]